MTRFPTNYKNRYHLSDVYISPIDKKSRGTGSDYSESEYILYIGSAPLERMVAIKAFFSSIKLNFQKEKENKTFSNQDKTYVIEKHGSLSYNISLDMPAHSVNESRNNLAKIEELQRLINKGSLWEKEKQYTTEMQTDPNNPKKEIEGQTFAGFGYNYISDNYKTDIPLFFVFFRNIINGGRKFSSSKISNFKDLGDKGFPCFIESVKFEPDMDAGFFEFDNFLFPKNIKLNLTLNYESETLFDPFSIRMNNRTIKPFTINGEITPYDTGLFPFHVDMSVKNMNDMSTNLTGKRRDSFMFIGSTKGLENLNQTSKKLTTKDSMPRYVVFDLFLDEFSRDLQYSFEKDEGGDSTVYSKVKPNLNVFKGLKYNTKINVVSENLSEAKRNAAKIQYLARMFFKTFYDGTQSVRKNNLVGLTKTQALQNVLVYIPSFIESPAVGGGSKQTSLSGMISRSIPLFIEEFSFDMDMELGFFKEGSKIYPKAYSLNLAFARLENDLILNYDLDYLDEKEGLWSINPLGDETIVNASNAYLFPFNRKTTKILGE